MKRTGFIFISLAFLASCSGYFPGNGGIQKLESGDTHLLLADGSGYLSTDLYNEITPFVFRNGGKTYLFYSSDKDGNYDINYAEMNTEGKFKNPIKMGNLINTAADEFSPVLLHTPISNYIIFLRGQSGSTNLILCFLDDNLNYVSETNLTPFISPLVPSHISGIKSDDNTILLLVSDGTSAFNRYSITDMDTAGYIRFNWDFTTNLGSSINSISGFKSQSGYFNGYYMMYDTMKSGKHQLSSGGAIIQGSDTIVIPFDINAYSSSANDSYPFIDSDDKYKVYFASDRYGKGNYDLYRYNTTMYDSQVPAYLKGPYNAIYVAPTGDDANYGIFPNAPLKTLTNAITKAQYNGLTNILAAAGIYTYSEGNSMSFSGAYSINILGGYNNTFTSLIGRSEIDMEGINTSAVYMDSSYNLTFANFEMRNTSGAPCIVMYNSSNINFINDAVKNNYSGGEASAGGFYISGSSYINFMGCDVSYNAASASGGGFYITYSQYINIINSTIASNDAGTGGGIYLDTSDFLNIINCTIMSNTASSSGGGVYFTYCNSNIINNCRILSNSAYDGGGIYFNFDNYDILMNCNIMFNAASGGGGGIFIYFDIINTININGCNINNNLPDQISNQILT